MKTRTGFVSNSSSSSFVIGWKRPSNDKSFDEDYSEFKLALNDLMIGLENSPFAQEIMVSVIEYIFEQVTQEMRDARVFSTFADYAAEHAYDEDEFENSHKTIKKLFDEGWVFAVVDVSNEDGDGISEMLFDMKADEYKYPNLYILNEGC